LRISTKSIACGGQGVLNLIFLTLNFFSDFYHILLLFLNM